MLTFLLAHPKSTEPKCCGLLPINATTATECSIQYSDILWAEASSTTLALTYTKPINKSKIRPITEAFTITSHDVKLAQSLAAHAQSRAYGSAQQRKRIKLIINPFGGKGKALKYWTNEIEPIFRAARCEVEVVHTTHQAHAEEIGEDIDIDKFDVVACCSGDGVPYEIWNGLARKKNARTALAKVAVVQLPCGTGNALSVNCNGTSSPSKAALAVVKGVSTSIDLASITQGEKRTLSFLSQALGIVAESDLGTESLRWLGDARFTVGFLKRLLRKTVWPCEIAVGVEIADKTEIQRDYRLSLEQSASRPIPPTSSSDSAAAAADVGDREDEGLPPLRYGTVHDDLPIGWELTPFPNLGNFYSGNMPFMAADANFFSFARINEGMLDLVTIRGDIRMYKSIAMLLSVGEGKLWQHTDVTYRKVSGFRVIPKQKEGYFAVDGERLPFQPFQVEVHKGLGTTLTREGRYFRPDEIV
jgi:sphingosine kinase